MTPKKHHHIWTLEEKDAIVEAVKLGHETGAQIKTFYKWNHLSAEQINGKMKHMRTKNELPQKDGLFQIIFYWVSLLITLVAFTAIEMLKRCQKDLGIEELPIGKKRPPAEPDAGQLPQLNSFLTDPIGREARDREFPNDILRYCASKRCDWSELRAI